MVDRVTTYHYLQPPAPVGRGRRMLHRVAPLFVLAPVALAVAYVLAFNPTDRVPDPTGPCTWHLLTGINGPGCGGTRMVWYLLHGNLVQAARHHLAALVAVPFLVYAYVQWVASHTFGLRLPVFRPSSRLVIGYVVAFVLYSMVLRNLPWPPFSWFDIENLT
jgi:uncharacterized protein DUF2752